MGKVISNANVVTPSILPGSTVQISVQMNEVGAARILTDANSNLCTCPAYLDIGSMSDNATLSVVLADSIPVNTVVKVRFSYRTQIYIVEFKVSSSVLGVLSLSNYNILGGSSGPVEVTLRLQNNAPVGGVEVAMRQEVGGLVGFLGLPSTVFIPEGSDMVQFFVNHTRVTRTVGVDVFANYAGSEARVFAYIRPAPP